MDQNIRTVAAVVGSNPGAGYWMDMTFFIFICCKKCIVCLKRPKINKKRPGWPNFLKRTVAGPYLLLLMARSDLHNWLRKMQ